MDKPIAVIEITDTKVRLLVGYILEGQPVVLYATEKPTNGAVSHGDIVDFPALVQIISSLKNIRDVEAKLKLTVSEATVVFPNIGFEVFQCEKTTNVVSSTNLIEQLDIQNVLSLVRKEPVPNGSEIIEIIPDFFILEGGHTFGNPPLGQKSSSITMRAKVHTLPVHIVQEYRRAVENAGIRAKRCVASPYALAELIKRTPDFPKSYLLIDLGADITSFNLIGSNSPFSSTYIPMGGRDLTRKIVEAWSISSEEAQKLKEQYGIDDRELSFKPKIAIVKREGMPTKSYTSSDLKVIIDQFIAEYLEKMDTALTSLLSGYKEEIKHLPIIFTGGFSKLYGFPKILADKFQSNESIRFLCPTTCGVRDTRWCISLGALFASSRYRGALTDQRAKVSQVERVSSKSKEE